MSFNVLTENKQFKNGDVIAVFKVNNSPKKYIMYSVEDYDEDESKILISYLEKGNNGYDKIVSIENPLERKKIISLIKNMIEEGAKI